MENKKEIEFEFTETFCQSESDTKCKKGGLCNPLSSKCTLFVDDNGSSEEESTEIDDKKLS